MSAAKDLTGHRFGKLVVIERSGSNKHKCCVWKCKCDCGNITYTTTQYLKKGDTRSCGCIRGKHNRTHGMTNTKLDRTYKNMIGRCYVKSNKEYKNYGERGISVCEEWLENPNGKIRFFEWAIENGFSDDLTLDRIDVNGNYEPDNCRWINASGQANNRSTNRYITYKGATHTIAEWARILDMPYSRIQGRLSKGWPADDIFEIGKLKANRKYQKIERTQVEI